VSEEGVERKLTTILATDVVGYSRLMGEDEAGTLARLKSLRKELVQPKITGGRGRIVKLMGDGLLAEFPSVVEAVRCAVDIQQDISGREAGLPDERRIRLRIGVNLGDIIVEGSDIYGDGVNVAARLEGLAEPGGICVSGKVYEEVRNKLPAAFEDLGDQKVKNIREPVRVYRWNGAAADPMPGTAGAVGALPLPDKPSIAVLPFDNMSGDPEQEYFVDGLTEDIITGLSRVKSLFVIARNSTFVYRGQPTSIAEVGRDLGVRYVLEGSARKVGSRIRVTAQLVQAETAGHLWAEKYDREVTDIFEVQDEITRAVVASTQTQVVISEGERRSRTVDGTAIGIWDLVKRGWKRVYDLTPDSFEDARLLALEAIQLDSSNSGGHQLHAAALYHVSWMGYSTDRDRDMAIARREAAEAVRLDNKDEYSHWILGLILSAGFSDHDSAIIEFRRALDINPNFSLGYAGLGTTYSFAGDADAGIAHAQTALRLNPQDPSNFFRYSGMAVAHFVTGEYEACKECAEKSRQGNADWRVAHIMLIASLVCLGEDKASRLAKDQFLRCCPDERIGTAGALPFSSDDHRQLLITCLAKAGLPE
jgi:adenylate cyclase